MLTELTHPIVLLSITEAIVKQIDEEDNLDAQWQAFIDAVTPYEKQLTEVIKKLFRGMRDEVIANMTKPTKALEPDDQDKVNAWVFGSSTWEERFIDETFSIVKAVLIDNGSRVLADLPLVAISFDVENPEVARLLKERSIKFSASVVGTTEEEIRAILAEGISAGESMPQLRNRIRAYFNNDAIPKRAEIIARTETIWASNAGAEMGYAQSGVVYAKEWLVANDERLCPQCREMGRRFGSGTGGIPIGVEFFKLGDTLTYTDENGKERKLTFKYEDIRHPPLHPRCRCTLIPLTKPFDED